MDRPMEAEPRCDTIYTTNEVSIVVKDRLEESLAQTDTSQHSPAPSLSSCVLSERVAESASQEVAEELLARRDNSNTESVVTQSKEDFQERLAAPTPTDSLTSTYLVSEAPITTTLTPVEMSTLAPAPAPASAPVAIEEPELRDEIPESILCPSLVPKIEPLAEDNVGSVKFCSSSENSNSPVTGTSQASPPLSESDTHGIKHSYDGPVGHQVLHLLPTVEQWADFPALLAFARSLHAELDGCFKIVLPKELQEPLPEKEPQQAPANAYRVRQINHRTFWQVSTVPSNGTFSSSEPDGELSGSVEEKFKMLKVLFNKSKERQMRNVRYRVDVPAWTEEQRVEAGVPRRSPIHPLAGDKLDFTKAIVPGIHTPYVYESAQHFGATFQLHAEDFRLSSLNHLYKGRKIWIVVPSTAVDVAEEALNRRGKCSQFMRHRAEFFFPEKLQKMGIPYRIVDQRPGETIVILPDAYHEGFSTGYTLAEAKNYADSDWTTDTYQPCELRCQLATAIPAEYMRPLREGEERLDLCAGYNEASDDDEQLPPQHVGDSHFNEAASTDQQPSHPLKRPIEHDASEEMAAKHLRLE